MIDVVTLGDSFALAYDRLAAHEPVSAELQDWSLDPTHAHARTSALKEIDATGLVSSETITAAAPAGLSGILSAIDHCLTLAGPSSLASDPRSRHNRRRFLETGRYNETTDGAVLPRYVEAGRPRAASEGIDEVFHNVRVSQKTWQRCEQINLHTPARRHLDVTVPANGIIRIGQIPLAAPDEIVLKHDQTSGGIDVYTAAPDPALEGRVAEAMQAFHDTDTIIGLVPEYTLDDRILAAWQRQAHHSGPDWVLVGTGPVTGTYPGSSAPTTAITTSDGQLLRPNRAVLMHGKTGEVIAVQDKRYGFTILPSIKNDYGLGVAPDLPLDEGISQGKRLSIIESRVGRVGILICEDLDHLAQDGAMLRELGVSLVLAPIVAPPIVAYRWQHQASNSLAKDIGSTVMTFNSLALGRTVEITQKDGTTQTEPAATLVTVTPLPNTYTANYQLHSNNPPRKQRAITDALLPRVTDLQTP